MMYFRAGGFAPSTPLCGHSGGVRFEEQLKLEPVLQKEFLISITITKKLHLMEKTQVISVRIPVSDLQALDERVKNYKWYTRNSCIVAILDAVVHCATPDAFQQLITNDRHFHHGEPINFSRTKK